MNYISRTGLALAGLMAATALSFPAYAQQTELTMYYPIAVGGPLTDVVDGMVEEFEAANPDIKVNAISGGLNYWATRHLRLTAQWTTYVFPDSAPPTPTQPGGPVCDAVSCANRAQAPAQSLPATPSNVPQSQLEARDNGHSLHELLFRAQVTF